MIDGVAVTLVDGTSVKIDDGVGIRVRVSATFGPTFTTGPGVLVVVTAGVQGNGSFTIVVAAVILVVGLSVKIEDGSD